MHISGNRPARAGRRRFTGWTARTVAVAAAVVSGVGFVPSTAAALTAQTITFTAIPNTSYAAGTVTASATASSGLPVTFTTATPMVCTVTGPATVNLVAVGTCTIDANQAGDGTYSAAPQVSRTFTVQTAPQTITFTPISTTARSVGTVTATATSDAGVPVTISSATTGVCTVGGPGTSPATVTLIDAGTCTLNANAGSDSNHTAAPQVQASFTVSASPQTITFTAPSPAFLPAGTTTATATSSSGLPVTITSATPSICTVNGPGTSPATIALVSAGTCTLNADRALGNGYTAATQVTRSFVVLAAASQTITFTPPADSALSDGSVTATATSDSDLPVTLTSTTTSVCTVAGPGTSPATVNLVGKGTCTLDADQAGDSTFGPAAQVSGSFTVSGTPQTIAFLPPGTTALASATTTATATTSSGLTASFTSATPSVCTVDTPGTSPATITLVGKGTCTLHADQAGDSTREAAAQVSGSFTVTGLPQTITFTQPGSAAITLGTVSIPATSDSGLPVTLSSTTPSVCTVTPPGTSAATVNLLSTGTCTLAADQSGDSTRAAATRVTRSFSVTGLSQTITFDTPPAVFLPAATTTVTATSTSGLPVTITSATAPVCTVDPPLLGVAIVHLVATGTCTLRANRAASGGYGAATQVSKSFPVLPGVTQTITFSPLPTALLSAGTVTATAAADSGLPVTITSATTNVCTVAGTSPATVTLVSAGTCTLYGDQAGDPTYAAATQTPASFAVKLGQTITFPTPANVASTTPSVVVTAGASSNLPVTVTSTTPSVCTVNGPGTSPATVTIVGTGTCTLHADQAGDTTYGAATQATASFMVLQPQTITFTGPSTTALSAGTTTATATSDAGLPVSFTSVTQGVCTVNAPGTSMATISLVSAGTCTLNANQAGDSTYAPAAQVAASFTVAVPPSGNLGPLTATAAGQVVTVAWDPSHVNSLFSTSPVIDVSVTGGTVAGGGTCVTGRPIASSGCTFTASAPGSFTIVAVPNSAQGYGTPVSTTVEVGTPGTPTGVSATVQDGQLVVQWTPSTQTVPAVQSYTATATGGASCSTADDTQHTCVISGVPAGQAVTVSVVAHGTNGVDSAAGTSPPVTVLGAPDGMAVRNAAGRLQLFWRGADNALWTSIQAPNGSWGIATSLGGGLYAEPSVARDAAGRLQVLAVGNGGNTTYQNRELTAGANVWSGWTPVTSTGLRTIAMAADSTGRLHLVATTSTGAVLYASMTDAGLWNTPTSLAGGLVTSAPIVVRGANGMLVVYGRSNGSMFQIIQNSNGTWPTSWTRIGVAGTALAV